MTKRMIAALAALITFSVVEIAYGQVNAQPTIVPTPQPRNIPTPQPTPRPDYK